MALPSNACSPAGRALRRRWASLAALLYAALVIGAPGLHLLTHAPDHEHVAGGLRIRGVLLAARGHRHGNGRWHADLSAPAAQSTTAAPGAAAAPAVPRGPRPPVTAAALLAAPPAPPTAPMAAPLPPPQAPAPPAEHAAGSVAHFAVGLLPTSHLPAAPQAGLLPLAALSPAPPARPPERPISAPPPARGPPAVRA